MADKTTCKNSDLGWSQKRGDGKCSAATPQESIHRIIGNPVSLEPIQKHTELDHENLLRHNIIYGPQTLCSPPTFSKYFLLPNGSCTWRVGATTRRRRNKLQFGETFMAASSLEATNAKRNFSRPILTRF